MRIAATALRLAIVAALLGAAVLEAYALAVGTEGAAPLPPLFGNFPANRTALEQREPKDAFTFAVVGDPRSVGTYQRLVDRLRRIPLDFVVLLGDVADHASAEAHRFLRAELADEYALPCPVFYVVGNHDAAATGYTLDDFERDYGPGIFSFRYQGCLFVVLCAAELPGDARSLDFLRRLANDPPTDARHVFVFLHEPPVQPGTSAASAKSPLVPLLRQIGADYVIAGHVHGYYRIATEGTTYLISGGGGAHLESADESHHAVIFSVRGDSVEETILHVATTHDAGDIIERFAVSKLGPALAAHPLVAVAANAGLLLALVVLLWSLARHLRGRRHSPRAPAFGRAGASP